MKRALFLLAALGAVGVALVHSGETRGGAITPSPGCLANDLGPADDSSSGAVALPFAVNYFGTTYSSLYVNNNGNVTFTQPLLAYTPFGLTNLHIPLIAPFFADVDTRGVLSGTTHYGATTVGGNDAFCVLWDGVGYYNVQSQKLNRFQLLLVDRPDRGQGDFDIVFDYDQVEWETGDASGGSGGLGGVSAEIGFSSGDVHFSLPGSLLPGSFLDSNPGGLVYGNVNAPEVPGRYVFRVSSGTPPIGHVVSGHVWDSEPGFPAIGAFVELCPVSPGDTCRTTTTSGDGSFTIPGVTDGTWRLAASPPGLSALEDGGAPVEMTGADVGAQDVTLQPLNPLPTGTTVTTPSRGVAADGIPAVFWGDGITVTAHGCTGGGALATLTMAADGFTEWTPLLEGSDGTYTGMLAALVPRHGRASVTTTVCGAGATFDLYVLPSGKVETVTGEPLPGATVTLLAGDTPAGPFVDVAAGSPRTSPGNRANPFVSEGGGAFGWDALHGYYKVRAEMTGCNAPGDPGTPFVESDVLATSPAVAGLVLTLECPAPPSDTTAPSFTASGLAVEATGPMTVVDYTFQATDPDDAVTAATCEPGPGSSFTVGSTPIHCTATDTHGNVGTADYQVVVSDTTAPTLSVPTTIHAEATSAAGAVVKFDVSAFDLVDGALASTCTPASAATFSIGTTSVECTAGDAHANHATEHFDIVVVDTTPPTLTLPSTIHVDAISPAGAVVVYEATATDVVSGALVPSCMPASLSIFPIGTTTVYCSATDGYGNTAHDQFDVVVGSPAGGDTTPPELTLPDSIKVDATSPDGAVVAYVVSATDDVDGPLTPDCSTPSGSLFAIGTTEITCTATDSSGNSSSGSFTVHVNSAAEQIVSLDAMVSDLALDRGLTKDLQRRLRDARRRLDRTRDACGPLQGFVEHVLGEAADDRAGLTIGQAQRLVDAADIVELALGCLAPDSPVPVAERDLLGLIGTIRDYELARLEARDLIDGTLQVALQLAQEKLVEACGSLDALANTVADGAAAGRLTEAQSAVLSRAVAAIAAGLGCPR